ERGVRGVLGELHHQPVAVPAEGEVLLGVGVLPEPGGRGRPRVENGLAQSFGVEHAQDLFTGSVAASVSPSSSPKSTGSKPVSSRIGGAGSGTGEGSSASEWAPHPWSAQTTRPSSGAYSFAHTPKSWPSEPASGQ